VGRRKKGCRSQAKWLLLELKVAAVAAVVQNKVWDGFIPSSSLSHTLSLTSGQWMLAGERNVRSFASQAKKKDKQADVIVAVFFFDSLFHTQSSMLTCFLC
jgi:hypothetical protein